MQTYLDLIQTILDKGEDKGDRTGTGTKSVFGHQMRFDLSEGFPMVTTKKLFNAARTELLWILNGRTDLKYLEDNGVKYWRPDYERSGRTDETLGPVYGKQWRDFNGRDQLADLVNAIHTTPDSRRMIVSAWNVGELNEMALMPCHALFQFHVANGKLNCQLYQRSADVFLGVPFNIASYALLTHMMAQVCGLQAGTFVHTLGDAHLYNNHLEQANLQLSRKPLQLPQLKLNPEIMQIDQFNFDDIEIIGYEHHEHIKAPIAI